MMLFAVALLALHPQAAATAPPVSEEEMFCVFKGLDDRTLAEMAELIVDNGNGSLPEIGEYASAAVDPCAKKWKWDAETRSIGALTAAARAATQRYEDTLKGRFSHAQLSGFFDELSDTDKQALTIVGYSGLTASDRSQHGQRLEALFKRKGVRPVEYLRVTSLFTAVARLHEMYGAWTQHARGRTR